MTEYIFWSRQHKQPHPSHVIVGFVGDVMLSRKVGETIQQQGPQFPFELIREELQRNNLLFGNLESTISNRGKPSRFVQNHFRAIPEAIQGLTDIPFTVLALANNHLYDYGDAAIEDTLVLLHQAGILTVGVGTSWEEARRPAIVHYKKVKIAFLAYTSAYNVIDPSHGFVAAPLKREWIQEDVSLAKQLADVCIVSLHWGYEGVEFPVPEHRSLAHKIIEAGADLIVGHHPHVLQGIEIYEGRPIVYSLGDFIFDGNTTLRRQTIILRAYINQQGVNQISIIPVWINDKYQPIPAPPEVEKEIIERIENLSQYISNGISDQKFWEAAGGRFLQDQSAGILRSLKRDGPTALLYRLRHARLFHLKLLWHAIWSKRRDI